MVNGTGFDVPPPGPEFVTVIIAVPKDFTIEAPTVALRVLPLVVVVNGVPFQLITEPVRNPVPFTLRVNDPCPGATLVGDNGCAISGSGFVVDTTP